MTLPERQKNRRWLVAGLVILLLGLALGFWLGFRGAPVPAPAGAASHSESVRPAPQTKGPEAGRKQSLTTDGANAPGPEATADLPTEPSPEELPEGMPQVHRHGTLLFTTFSKKPAVGVTVVLSYHLQRSPEVDNNLVEEKVTDQLGEVTLTGEECSSSGMAVKINSEGWQIPPGVAFGAMRDGWLVTGPMAVVLERTRTVQVKAEYADGQPYEGQVMVRRETASLPEPVEMTRGFASAVVPADDPFYNQRGFAPSRLCQHGLWLYQCKARP